MEPIVVYYLHYKDAKFMERNWNRKGDYVACVNAKNAAHAIEKVQNMIFGFIKILGTAAGKPEWVNESGSSEVLVTQKQSK